MDESVQKIQQKEIVMILGMHRSGTSLTAQICKKMGVYLGEEVELMQADEYNRSGYFENQKISELDDAILQKCGKTWFSLKRPDTENKDGKLEKIKGELRLIISNLLQKSDIVGIKDPRISVLLPFWDQVLSELHVSIKYLWVIRNPESVAASLAERDGFNREFGCRLWLHYNLCIWEFLKDREYLKFDYQDILNSKRDEENKFVIADEIAEFAGMILDGRDRYGLDEIIRPEYAHRQQGCSPASSNHMSAYEFYKILKNKKERRSNLEQWTNYYTQTAVRLDEKYVIHETLYDKAYLQTKRIIIYGAGNYGKQVTEKLKNIGIFHYDFCDKDKARHGEEYCGGKIVSIDDIDKQDHLFIIVALGDEHLRRGIEESMAYLSGAVLFPLEAFKDEKQTI